MKTSNILFTTAILFFLTYLIVFDFGLKSQYNSIKKMGLMNYEKMHRFDEFQKVNVGPFKNIDLKASNLINVRVEFGKKEAVWVLKYKTEAIRIDNETNHLFVGIKKDWKGNYFSNRDFEVIIITPKVEKLTTSNILNKGEWGGHRNEVSGFTQDSMFVTVSDSAKVDMTNNRIQNLHAMVGSGLAGGNFFVAADNKIRSMKLFVEGKSSVELLNTDMIYLEKHLSDSSKVTFKGSMLKGMTQK